MTDQVPEILVGANTLLSTFLLYRLRRFEVQQGRRWNGQDSFNDEVRRGQNDG